MTIWMKIDLYIIVTIGTLFFLGIVSGLIKFKHK